MSIKSADRLSMTDYGNVLETGEISKLTKVLDSNKDINDYLHAYMECLSQTLSVCSKKYIYKHQVESILKGRIYAFVKNHPKEALAVINRAEFKNNDQLKTVNKTVNYLAKNRIARVIYHLMNDLSSSDNFNGLTCIISGVSAFLLQGIAAELSSQDHTKDTGVAFTTIGSALLALPFLHAGYRGFFTEEP